MTSEWGQLEPGVWETVDYTITRTPDYHYLLTHKTAGVVRKYRLLEGAKRAAARHETKRW